MNLKERNSNFELMRIISMFFIVIFHIIQHCNYINDTMGFSNILIVFLKCLIFVHVPSFIIITGYFQCESKVNFKKVISIINQTWFYKTLYLIIFLFLINKTNLPLVEQITTKTIITTLLPFDRNTYWYINCYLILYLLSPMLNIIIKNTSKKQLRKIILLLFFLFSVIGTLSIGEIIPNYYLGCTVSCFILLYFIGAYLRKYPINNNYVFQKFSLNLKRIIFILIYLILAIISFFCFFTSKMFSEYGAFSNSIGEILDKLNCSYLSPIVIIQAIVYFLFFETFKFKSNFINKLSKTTLGVYLIHENILIRKNIYIWLNFDRFITTGSLVVIIIIIVAIIMFIICTFIEYIRQKIFKFIYNRKLSRKLSKKVCEFIGTIKLLD